MIRLRFAVSQEGVFLDFNDALPAFRQYFGSPNDSTGFTGVLLFRLAAAAGG